MEAQLSNQNELLSIMRMRYELGMATRLDTHTQVLSDQTAFLVEATTMDLAAGIEDPPAPNTD